MIKPKCELCFAFPASGPIYEQICGQARTKIEPFPNRLYTEPNTGRHLQNH